MNKRFLWMGVVLGLAACGGDEDGASSPTLDSSSNNATVNGSSNNNTAHLENNYGEADAGSDSGFADADPGLEDAATNATNNSTSTNNSTNNINAGVTCMEILQCLLVCNTEDEICRQDCKETGSPAAHRKIDAYLGCVDTLCADATGVTELTECVLDKCGTEQAACLE